MTELWTNRWTLRALYASAMGKAFLRFRNPRRRSVGKHQDAFNMRTWRESAEALGGTYEELGSGIGEITLPGAHGVLRTRVVENVSAIDDPVTLGLLHDKPLTHELLKKQGLPVPQNVRFTLSELKPALEFLARIGRDCVVKPAGGTGGGRGVTTGIRTTSHLVRAAALAAVYGDDLMIEEQITGDNYRLLYLDGQLIDAFVRKLPAVVADGKSTIAALVRKLNDERVEAGAGVSQVMLTVDMDMRRTLAKQGFGFKSVPSKGTYVTLKTVVNENGGADNSTVTHLLHPSIVEDCARAVRALRVRFAGIDLVMSDPRVPLAESGGVILEINGTPNLYYHYHKQDGSFPVAKHLLQRLLQGHESNPTNANLQGAFQCQKKCSRSTPLTTRSSSPVMDTCTSVKV